MNRVKRNRVTYTIRSGINILISIFSNVKKRELTEHSQRGNVPNFEFNILNGEWYDWTFSTGKCSELWIWHSQQGMWRIEHSQRGNVPNVRFDILNGECDGLNILNGEMFWWDDLEHSQRGNASNWTSLNILNGECFELLIGFSLDDAGISFSVSFWSTIAARALPSLTGSTAESGQFDI